MGMEFDECEGLMGESPTLSTSEVAHPRRLDDMSLTFAVHELYNNCRIRASVSFLCKLPAFTFQEVMATTRSGAPWAP